MYLLLSGTPPFLGKNESQIEDKVIQGRYYMSAPIWKTVSQEAKTFLQKLLEYQPNKRISAADALLDPWFSNVSSKPIDKKNSKFAQEVMQNLYSFQTKRKFQDAIWVFMVQHFIAEEEKKQLTMVFQELDIKRNGFLSKDEFIQGFRKYNKDINEEEATDILNRIDRNMNGNIDYSGINWCFMTYFI